ncbi:MAG: GlsB/YeaQ/YmgE family stress response membrane protein [Candidatus Komeilibacteria bacterium]|nr:GlsB/YeaQ/YmgE family stress response membrane protein [Candidatus Komeilibacteria bacterium]
MDILLFLLIGLLAGWIASLIVKGRGFGLIGDMVVGVVGALLGGLLFGSSSNFLLALLSAIAGAVILLLLIKLIKRA